MISYRILFVLLFAISLTACMASKVRTEESAQVVESPTATPTAVAEANQTVRDDQAAIEIALKTWIPIYGKEHIDGEKPYVAQLKNSVWHVRGSLPEGMDGGVAEAWISQVDGRVLRYSHGQ